jgi:serine/threonine protein kinase
MGEDRCRKLRARRRDTGELRFLKQATGIESRQFLENEASVLSRVSHPQLIKLERVHQDREQMVLEFEYVQAAQLRFPLGIERLCRIMYRLAEVLAALHGHGLLHGDVKPQNILFRGGASPERDELVLCDLEFAQEPGPSRFRAMTPLFSAPEQIVGDRVDFRADVYAFGVVFYLWFFYDRLPAILDEESPGHRTMGNILGTAPYRPGTPLEETTVLEETALHRLALPTHIDDPTAETVVLGAKHHFSAELERITNVNKRLDLTADILKLVSETTEFDPHKRPADGRALVERLEGLLRTAEGTPVV